MFTNQHAYPVTADFFNDLNDLDRIDWPLLQSRNFQHDPDDPGKKERYQAEALIWMHLPLEALLGIGCCDERARAAIQGEIDGRNLALKAHRRSDWYF